MNYHKLRKEKDGNDHHDWGSLEYRHKSCVTWSLGVRQLTTLYVNSCQLAMQLTNSIAKGRS